VNVVEIDENAVIGGEGNGGIIYPEPTLLDAILGRRSFVF
jgi:hypothetical protein